VQSTPAIRRSVLPDGALLRRYTGSGGYADCYVADIAARVSHAQFVESFYTTAVFKLERLILRQLAGRPSTDAQATQLAHGSSDSFAAWTVEGRAPDQLLLRDYTGRTRSWLMVAAAEPAGSAVTRLFFGSAVVPKRDPATGRSSLGFVFRSLLGFHKLYSRVLLSAARSRLLLHAENLAKKELK
jgi:hypothetical protein